MHKMANLCDGLARIFWSNCLWRNSLSSYRVQIGGSTSDVHYRTSLFTLYVGSTLYVNAFEVETSKCEDHPYSSSIDHKHWMIIVTLYVSQICYYLKAVSINRSHQTHTIWHDWKTVLSLFPLTTRDVSQPKTLPHFLSGSSPLCSDLVMLG